MKEEDKGQWKPAHVSAMMPQCIVKCVCLLSAHSVFSTYRVLSRIYDDLEGEVINNQSNNSKQSIM